ncbi:MFS transporter [Penaeicola halotolerans]|uniref:MFS transporter n=1 Tax=Penaeicola halotolerans TaxID=2793196 RepID=UPI001CF8D9C7|nr:MFS transporter [Penaeicola halotolerans]
MKPPKRILPIIVFAQFCCTSLWFAVNGVMAELIQSFDLEASDLGHITSAVQIGFIVGTLIFSILTISDRYSPSKVFLICAVLGALFNLAVIWEGNSFMSLLGLRFLTGFCLAGIYPVGMKIASDYFDKGLGQSLGFLVGALVLGTAFPHLARNFTQAFAWEYVLLVTSSLALIGGLLIWSFVPDGPFRQPSKQFRLQAFYGVFHQASFRRAAFGYFGHMWELYAFWAFVPFILQTYSISHPGIIWQVPLLSFWVIAAGGLACVLGAFIAVRLRAKGVARVALLLSCLCCLVSPFMLVQASELFFVVFLVFWGMVVVADSPLLSTLVAQNAQPEIRGTSLTIVNCIGFFITILSIQLLSFLQTWIDPIWLFPVLAIGPVFGLIALFQKG